MPQADLPASDRGTDDDGHEGVWRSRAFAAAAVRLLAIGGPVALGTLTARLVVGMFSAGTSTWLVSITALLAATVVSLLTARLGMRLLPLAVLLKMTMVFPDRAPSRAKVAKRASSAEELRRRLADPNADERETATTLLALVTALGRHDRKTRGHSERVRLFCDLIGRELGLSEADCGRLRWVGLLHDIGKLEVAASVLNKPSKLDPAEWDVIRTHPDSGARLARPLAQWLGPWFDGIEHHHERFDGMGYPQGLAGDEISLAGRAVAVVDAFETMTAARSYKSPMTTAAARAELTRCAGSHFDPAMVRAFLAIALPRLFWTMGPLTFLVNIPFLRWMPAASERAATLANASVGAASNAVGVTAVSVAIAAAPTSSLIHTHAHPSRMAGDSASVVRLSDHPETRPGAGAHSHRHPTVGAPARSTPPPAPSGGSAAPAARTQATSAVTGAPVPAPPTSAPVHGPAAVDDETVVGAPGSDASTPDPAPSAGASDAASSVHPGKSGKPTPPGQSKTPPGQSKTPPGQSNKPAPPGQSDKPTPPGQSNKPAPPGQSDKPTPPGQSNKPAPPGQSDKPTPPGQSDKPAPPGQGDKPNPPGHSH